jgi:hypothetical protein
VLILVLVLELILAELLEHGLAADYRSATGATAVIGTLNATWYITGAFNSK